MTARATVLAYHGVGEPPPGEDRHGLFISRQRFTEQLAFLAARRNVVPLAEITHGAAGRDRHAVAITFDDGYRHLLTAALPLLEQHGFPSTVFVPTQYVGQRNGWDEDSACDLDIMTTEELREADARGLSVESHGHAHLDCSTATPEAVRADLEQSRRRLQELVGRAPRFLAWPFRDGSPDAQAIAEQVGFDAAFSIDLPHAGRFSFERVQVTPRDNPAMFALKTSGRYMQLRHHKALARAYRLSRAAQRRGRAPH